MMNEALKALFSHTVRRMTRSWKLFIFGFLIILPWLIVILLRILIAKGIDVPIGGSSLYDKLVLMYEMSFLIPVATLFFGTSLIADEVEGGTLPYLFGRPIKRAKIYIVRYIAMSTVLIIGLWIADAGTYFLSMWGGGRVFRDIGILTGNLIVTAVSILAYGALFALLGLALKKPLFWAFLVGFGWENTVGWLPGFLKRFTLLFHLHTLMPRPPGPEGLVQNILASSESRVAAIAFLAVYVALFLSAACLLIQRREAPASDKEGT